MLLVALENLFKLHFLFLTNYDCYLFKLNHFFYVIFYLESSCGKYFYCFCDFHVFTFFVYFSISYSNLPLVHTWLLIHFIQQHSHSLQLSCFCSFILIFSYFSNQSLIEKFHYCTYRTVGKSGWDFFLLITFSSEFATNNFSFMFIYHLTQSYLLKRKNYF